MSGKVDKIIFLISALAFAVIVFLLILVAIDLLTPPLGGGWDRLYIDSLPRTAFFCMESFISPLS